MERCLAVMQADLARTCVVALSKIKSDVVEERCLGDERSLYGTIERRGPPSKSH